MEWKYSKDLKCWTGNSTVPKPISGISRNEIAYEYDTGASYIFNGTKWILRVTEEKYKDLGLVIDATNMAAGASIQSSWVDNLQWVRNVIVFAQSDQQFDISIQKRGMDESAYDSGSLSPNNLGLNQSATLAPTWRNLTATGQTGLLGYSARFIIKNSSANANTYARLRVQLLGA